MINKNYKISEQHLEELFKKDMTELVGGFLEYKHLYDEDPEVIVKNISLYIRYVAKNDNTLEAYNKALDIFNAFNFDLLFGKYTFNKKVKTSTIYRDILIAYFEKYKKVKKEQVLGLAFEKQINAIPVKELKIECKKQKVTTKEVMFFLKTITFKITDTKNKNDYCLTLGIGAGENVDGQLIIAHDLLGFYDKFRPKFAKCYINQILTKFVMVSCKETREDGFLKLAEMAIKEYIKEVKDKTFPGKEYSYEKNTDNRS